MLLLRGALYLVARSKITLLFLRTPAFHCPTTFIIEGLLRLACSVNTTVLPGPSFSLTDFHWLGGEDGSVSLCGCGCHRAQSGKLDRARKGKEKGEGDWHWLSIHQVLVIVLGALHTFSLVSQNHVKNVLLLPFFRWGSCGKKLPAFVEHRLFCSIITFL